MHSNSISCLLTGVWKQKSGRFFPSRVWVIYLATSLSSAQVTKIQMHWNYVVRTAKHSKHPYGYANNHHPLWRWSAPPHYEKTKKKQTKSCNYQYTVNYTIPRIPLSVLFLLDRPTSGLVGHTPFCSVHQGTEPPASSTATNRGTLVSEKLVEFLKQTCSIPKASFWVLRWIRLCKIIVHILRSGHTWSNFYLCECDTCLRKEKETIKA